MFTMNGDDGKLLQELY